MGREALAVIVAVTALSQFYRSCLGVIAPELSRDLELSPEALGSANGAFFLAMALAQIPVGMLFDRFGPRRTVAAFTAVAFVAAIWQAMAASAEELIAARFLLGLGCAASFMGAVTLCSWWYPGAKLSTMLSRMFAFSQVGIFLAATPLAVASATLGWRWSFAGMAIATAATGVLFFLLVRDRAPQLSLDMKPESMRDVARGLLAVWRTPGLAPVLAIHTFAYASMATVMGLWAGPYLSDVHGLDGPARGNVILAMAAAQLAGILAYGPLDRVFNTRKWIVVPGALCTIATLATLASVPSLPLWAAVALLVLFCGVTSYAVVIVAHGSSLFPPHLTGRGVTTVNLAQVIGLAGLPVLTGAIVGAFPEDSGGAHGELAYRWAFGSIAAVLALGLAIYLTAQDAKPDANPDATG
ncbi:MAG: MFS transporter [Betaproteobacteria bacterium]